MMNDDENDEEQQSLIHAHELKINAQDQQIRQQAALVKEQAALMKRLEEKVMKLDKEALKNSNAISSSEVTRNSRHFAINNQVGEKQDWSYDLGMKSIKDTSWNFHVKNTDMNMRELRASIKDQEDKMKVMEAAHQLEMDKVNKEIKSLLEIKSLVESSSTENATTSLVAEIESDQEVEIDSYNSRDNDTFDISPNLTTASSDAGPPHLRSHVRGLAFSIFSKVGRSSRRKTNDTDLQERELTSEDELFYLDEDTYSFMMISRRCTGEWLLGIVTFVVFQLWLEILILFNLLDEYFNNCELIRAYRVYACVPFNVPINPPVEVTCAQGIALLLVLATQSDILTSINTILTLQKNADNVPWDKLIGEEGNRSLCLWLTRILLPNLAKFIQGGIILFISFVIIVQSRNIIDLLKDFTSLLVVSQADNIIFDLADAGYLGKHLAKRTKEVKTRHIEIGSLPDRNSDSGGDEEGNSPDRKVSRCSFCNAFTIKSIIFGGMCCGMIGAWAWFVYGQYSGYFFTLKYPNCMVSNPEKLGDGNCDWHLPHNSPECNRDGGDCIVEGYPECYVQRLDLIGDRRCDDIHPYNTPECGYDGGDCRIPQEVEGLPGCFVTYPWKLGDRRCDLSLPYNSPECNYDNGDCKQVEGYPNCYVGSPSIIGNGYCDESFENYNTPECGYDGGDCSR